MYFYSYKDFFFPGIYLGTRSDLKDNFQRSPPAPLLIIQQNQWSELWQLWS
jgi:hypothetical protein